MTISSQLRTLYVNVLGQAEDRRAGGQCNVVLLSPILTGLKMGGLEGAFIEDVACYISVQVVVWWL